MKTSKRFGLVALVATILGLAGLTSCSLFKGMLGTNENMGSKVQTSTTSSSSTKNSSGQNTTNSKSKNKMPTPKIFHTEEFINTMIFVEGGSFQMGSDDGDASSKPVHKVTVDSFYMSRTPVSLTLYGETTGKWPFDYHRIFSVENYDIPAEYAHLISAEGVSWYEAIRFCNLLSIQEGLTPCYAANGSKDAVTYSYCEKNSFWDNYTEVIDGEITCDWNANGYRLPTEAEWEYAARGGKYMSPYKFSGSNNYKEVIKTNYEYLAQKLPNKLELYDMTGGPEWCWDYYSSNYYKESNNTLNPRGPKTGELFEKYLYPEDNQKVMGRVTRGGYGFGQPQHSMVYARLGEVPEFFSSTAGPMTAQFRIVRNGK